MVKQYIDKSALVAEIEERRDNLISLSESCPANTAAKSGFYAQAQTLEGIKNFIDTLEVKDPYEQCIQYDSIKAGIQAHAETYSFNIESELFNQLTKEQQALWRKEIEQAVISGGDAGVSLAKDTRYKENHDVKEVEDLNKEIEEIHKHFHDYYGIVNSDTGYFAKVDDIIHIAKHFFELGMAVNNKAHK